MKVGEVPGQACCHSLPAEMLPQNLWHPCSYQINSLGWMRSQWIPNEVAMTGQSVQVLHKQCSTVGLLPLAPFACLQAAWAGNSSEGWPRKCQSTFWKGHCRTVPGGGLKTFGSKRAPGIWISASRSEARRLRLSEAIITPCTGTGFIVVNVLGIRFSHLIANYLRGCGERLKSEKTLKAKSVWRQFILFPRLQFWTHHQAAGTLWAKC